jgi:transcriptional regulator with XRE-family HTH domain
MERTLGQEIRRLRTEADYTLRKLAEKLDISAAYLSDLEHDRRRPPEHLLKKIVNLLQGVGANYETLEQLDTRLDPDIRDWANVTPGVREMLRKVRNTGHDPRELLRELEEFERSKHKKMS